MLVWMERRKLSALHRCRFPAWAKDIEQGVLAWPPIVLGMANFVDPSSRLAAGDILFYALLALPRF